MALSPNYSWAEPDNSSLVKNGAQDIRALGDAIDTSVWNIGYGQAGKNKIINGNYAIWQRGTSFTHTSGTPLFSADRFQYNSDGTGGSITLSQQTFTSGAAPVAGYEGTFFHRYACTTARTGQTYNLLYTKAEDVRLFAGQTATLSFWAKASSSVSMNVSGEQNFGSGGSGSVSLTYGTAAVTTAWTRFSYTLAIPSISGKTVGTSSNLTTIFGMVNTTGLSIDLWGVQLEYGAKMTPFQTASGGSPQGELAMCQRYYETSYDIGTAPATATETGSYGFCVGTNTVSATYFTYANAYKVTKRATPTITLYDLSGNSGKVNKVSAVDLSMTANQTAAADRIGQSEFRVYAALGTAGGFYGHYVASAEL